MTPVVGIDGANGSGKTNVLTALRLMRDTILRSGSRESRQNQPRRIPFALYPRHAGEPSYYQIDIVTDDIQYSYGFGIDDERVVREWLHAYPDGRQEIWLEREGDHSRFPEAEPDTEEFDRIRDFRSDELVVSVAARWNHYVFRPVYDWFRINLWLISPDQDFSQRLVYTQQMVLRDNTVRERIAGLLVAADLGITDIEAPAIGDDEVRLVRRGDGQSVTIELGSESRGTQRWFALLGPLLDAFDRGTTVLVDELDASLHPILAEAIIRMFESTDSNPHDAQMMFTAYDAALLMNKRLLRGDPHTDHNQIWLTEKGNNGATELVPLNSYNLPSNENNDLAQRYFLGRYGGIPVASPNDIARELRARRSEP
ncbi:AAA family ATPase [Sciscionella marina]|uniref:AAA family ATPase n=1 Tax=Sciscionella marina TaxID=508770 RepID=UPI0012F68448|nr:ATP-binding protein [Sciscionella marina]